VIVLNARKSELELITWEPLVSGASQTYKVQILFGEEWDELNKVVIFGAGRFGEPEEPLVNVIPSMDGLCEIPHEVLIESDRALYIGVQGSGHGVVVLPTVWTDLGTIQDGAELGRDAVPPTPNLIHQLLERAHNAEEKAANAEKLAAGTKEAKEAAAGSAKEAAKSAEALSDAVSAAENARKEAVDAAGVAASAKNEARKSAERVEAIALNPTKVINGTFWSYNQATGAYEDTGNPAQGPKGDSGVSAGFGEITATVDEGTGAPSVEVKATGPDTAKNLVFAFHGLKGAPGEGGGGAGKRVARFTVGTSTAGWTEADCDYLCDGTEDDVEINAAIQALPATGGEVVLLDGTYNLASAVTINKSKVTLSGNGQGTKVVGDCSAGTKGVIALQGESVTVRRLNINVYGSGAMAGVSVNYSYCSVIECFFSGGFAGVIFLGDGDGNNFGIEIRDNTFLQASTGVLLLNTKIYACKITGNTFRYGQTGISLKGSIGTVISNNVFWGCAGAGIKLASCYDNTVTGNCMHPSNLLDVITTYGVDQKSIYLSGTGNTNNLITGNMIKGKDCVDDGGTGNIIVNNMV